MVYAITAAPARRGTQHRIAKVQRRAGLKRHQLNFALDRVAQQHGSSERVSPALPTLRQKNVTNDNEPYRWKPSKTCCKRGAAKSLHLLRSNER
ncbi:hypothetical protein OH492_06610 [Vibrio chagasii]|nr:hypothetical protein [Vibrio chagasii]